MGIIKEYLGLFKKGIENPFKILEGIINNTRLELGSLPEDEFNEIVRRRVICENCPFMSKNAEKDPLQNYKTDRLDAHCSKCFCNINLKTASLESNCGLEAWNKEHPEHYINLKWHKYDKKNTR